MPSTTPFSLPPASAFKESLACLVFGTIVATAVYGVTVLQIYIYFGNSGRDSKRLKTFVALLFALDTVSLALIVDILYQFIVSDFGQPLLLLKPLPAMAWENGVTIVIATLTQCYFAHRLWILSRGNVVLVSTITVLALCSCGSGIVISVNFYTHASNLFLGSIETRILSGIANGLSVICDIVIAASLSYYLHSKRTGFKRTDSMISRLIIYAVNRGALTAICQAGHMITTVALPGRFIFLLFAFLDGRLYCNTLLATLNAQRSLAREDGVNALEMGPVHVCSSTLTFTAENEKRWETAGCRSATASSSSTSEAIPSLWKKVDAGHPSMVYDV